MVNIPTPTIEYAGCEFEGGFEQVADYIKTEIGNAAGNRRRQDELFADLAQVEQMQREYVEAATAEAQRAENERRLGGRTIGEGIVNRRATDPQLLARQARRAEADAQFADLMLNRASAAEQREAVLTASRDRATNLRAAAEAAAKTTQTTADDDEWPAGWG